MILYFIILIFMTMLGAVASLFLKKASGADNIPAMLKNGNLYLGGALYLLSAVLNIYVLKFLDYSVVLPLTSLTYIWTMLLSYGILKERLTGKKIAGTCLILIGALFVSL